MSSKLILTLAACLSLGACATVDLNDVASSKASTSSKVVDINVVQRAASKLYAAFTNRGFVANTSRKRVHSAAMVLLEGMDSEKLTKTDAGYVETATDSTVVLSDIRIATNHVEQTTKAAEVYLAIVPTERSLREELSSLEQALLASREAEQIFETALDKTGANKTSLDYVSYATAVDSLRDVTDAFGDRVREAQSDNAAAIF